jgi:hypothetical protein
MKIYSPLIFCLFVCLVLGSCRVNRQVTQTNDNATENSKIKVTRYKDTILYTPRTSTGLSLPVSAFSKCNETKGIESLKPNDLPKEKPQVWSQKNGNAKVKIEYIHDTIKVTAECDSIALSAKIREELQSEFNSKKSNSSSNTEKTTGYGFWDLVKSFLAGIAFGLAVYFLIKLIK